MLTLMMTRGLPASGKTTWAREYIDGNPNGSVTRVNKDDLRAMMHNSTYTKQNEKVVLDTRDAAVSFALTRGQHVIVDDTNFAFKHEQQLRRIAEQHDARFEVVDFTDVPLAECLERNRNRRDKNPVPEQVIRRMWNECVAAKVAPVYDDQLPWCVIVDIDGTLAHMNGRSPYDWDRVGEDTVDPHVRSVVRHFAERYDIVLMSGRDGAAYELTLDWLDRHNIHYDMLVMRKTGDMRKDSIVKRELFHERVEPAYYPALVIDDRQQVVDMWRNELGLKVWQVAEGAF